MTPQLMNKDMIKISLIKDFKMIQKYQTIEQAFIKKKLIIKNQFRIIMRE